MNLLEIFPDLITLEKWNVRSSKDPGKLYLVEKLSDNSLQCDCPAGMFKRDCRHKRLIREKFDFEVNNKQ